MSEGGGENPGTRGRGDAGEAEEIDLQRVHGSILREHHEPAEGRESVPLWFVSVIMLLVFWGGFYLATNSGGFRADVFVPHRVARPDPNAPPPAPAELGRRVYVRNCVLCHQATGLGVGTQYPPLAGSEWVRTDGSSWQREEHLVAVLLHGMEGPVEVRGRIYNGAMPPWKLLRDEEIAAVLTYIRSEWGNAAAPVEPGFVAEMRRRTQERRKPWTVGELRDAVIGQ